MSDNLRYRIAAVLREHVEDQLTNYDAGRNECGCGNQGLSGYVEHVADAVIAELDWEWGIQYHAVPSGVVLGRDENPDGSVTQTVWLSSERHARQVLDSPVPVSAIKGTKRLVRRAVGPIEDQPDITGEGWGIHRRTVSDWTFIPGPDYPAEGVADD